jgi:hypothetical protein
MAWLKRGGERLKRTLAGLKKELLRDPDVILFEYRPESEAVTSREVAGAR